MIRNIFFVKITTNVIIHCDKACMQTGMRFFLFTLQQLSLNMPHSQTNTQYSRFGNRRQPISYNSNKSQEYKNWGLGGLNEHVYKASIKAMKQADTLIERILLLEGLPNLQDLGKLLIGEDCKEMLQGDIKLMKTIHKQLIEAIAHAESISDYVSREVLEDILAHSESHQDWLETQLELIDKVGLKNYLQSNM